MEVWRTSSNSTLLTTVIRYSQGISIVAATFAIAFVILGVTGNALTIIALVKCPKLRAQATTWFVISLCISDVIFSAFNLSLTATRFIFRAWVLGEFLCWIFPFFFYANFGVSLYHIMLIGINRFILISSYTNYKKVYTPTKVAAQIVAVWIMSFLIVLPPFLGLWGTMGLDEDTYSCTILKKDGYSPKKFLFAFGILPPFLIVLYCYIRILMCVNKSKEVLRRMQMASGVPRNTIAARKDDLRLTKTMLLIFGCFILCFAPLFIVNVLGDEISYPEIHIASSILAWASAVINPIIYSVSSKSYRAAYYNLFGIKGTGFQCRKTTSAGGRTTTSDTATLG